MADIWILPHSGTHPIAPCYTPVIESKGRLIEEGDSLGGERVDRETSKQIIEQYRTHASDTGSTDVQVALLSHRIRELTSHVQVHRHDHATRRGLLKLVGQRRRLLRYLRREDAARYQSVVSSLGIRG